MIRIIEQLKDKIRRYRSKDTEDTGLCPFCKDPKTFTVPKKGYTSFTRRCAVCGMVYVARSNYGTISMYTLQEAQNMGNAIAEMVIRNCDTFSPHEKETLAEHVREKEKLMHNDHDIDDILSTWRHRKRDRV